MEAITILTLLVLNSVMIATDACFLDPVGFCSMKRTLARYNKCLESPETAIIEYKEEVLFSELTMKNLLLYKLFASLKVQGLSSLSSTYSHISCSCCYEHTCMLFG